MARTAAVETARTVAPVPSSILDGPAQLDGTTSLISLAGIVTLTEARHAAWYAVKSYIKDLRPLQHMSAHLTMQSSTQIVNLGPFDSSQSDTQTCL